MLDKIIIPIIFGTVQGLTEFLPVSSSGHLLVLHEFFTLQQGSEASFDVFLHLATLLAALIYFRQDIVILFQAVFSPKEENQADRKIAWSLVLATFPAALVGFLWEDIIEDYLRDVLVVVFMLVFVACLFLLLEKFKKKKYEKYNQLNWRESLVIGLAQALALVPGTSRSGITMITALWLGLKRSEAIKFSFLLSIPIIAGANVMKFPELLHSGLNVEGEGLGLCLAFLSAFLSAFWAIKYLLRFARRHTLASFAYYRILLAGALLINLFFF